MITRNKKGLKMAICVNNYLLVIFLFVLAGGGLFAGPLTVESPEGRASASFEVKDGILFYSVKHDESLIIDASELRIFSNSHRRICLSTTV